jgi:hypothetical protein
MGGEGGWTIGTGEGTAADIKGVVSFIYVFFFQQERNYFSTAQNPKATNR